MTRAGFLRWLASGLAAGLKASLTWAAGMNPRAPRPESDLQPITPTSEFYLEDVSGPPESAKQLSPDWFLEIHGRVERPLRLDYPALLRRAARSETVTLNCIGNPVGGYAIGNAEWRGVPLADLLKTCRPEASAEWLILRAGDGYFESLPLRQAGHPAALLATHMNRRPLTPGHGYPLRLILPGLYGIKQVKWLSGIELSDRPQAGYWHKRGWSREARVQILSRIDHPREGAWLERGRHEVRGIAFAGDRGIEYVQVSADNGRTWDLARLDPPLSDYAWVFWRYPVTFSRSGRYTLTVRAADRYSGVQDGRLRDPFPQGVTGYHRITFKVY